MMSAEDVFELEQRRIHEDLTKELRRQLAEEQKMREKADQARHEEQTRREEEQRRREEADQARQEEQKRRQEAELEIERLRKLLDGGSSS